MLTQHKKGQVAVMDLFIAAMIFGLIVVAVMFSWNNYDKKIKEQINYNTNLIKAYHISDLLSRYPGKPTDWESYNETTQLTILGLASDDGIIDDSKLSYFLSMSESDVKEILRISAYKFYFRLSAIDGSFNLETGDVNGTEDIIALRRFVLYNDTESIMEIKLQE